MRQLSSWKPRNFSEEQLVALPAIIATLLLSIILFLDGLFDKNSPQAQIFLIIAGLVGAIYTVAVFVYLIPLLNKYRALKWIVPVGNALLLSGTMAVEPYLARGISLLFIGVLIVAMSVLFGRWPTYLFAAICFSADRIFLHQATFDQPFAFTIESLVIPIFSFVAIETITRLRNTLSQQVHRSHLLNMVARSVASTIEIEQVIALLNSTIQNALDADTYYVGLVQKEGSLHLELLYDDGEFYPPTDLPLENTLAGWVIRNRKSLFLSNLPDDMPKLGIKRFVVGKPRASISWMGTTLESGGKVLGIVAVASYAQNAFKKQDLELLENVAKQAAMAIDNGYHHAEVERQSRLDSLTGAYNHRSFIHFLEERIQDAQVTQTFLSVIMLDIDHFKSYNDRYGHLVGDQVLTKLIDVIRLHIRERDLVGRWGGEEFCIALDNTNLNQAISVALRIQQSMSEVKFNPRNHEEIPAPTVSQGISVFPEDCDETFGLIDIADQRLYIAKRRGRNEVEPCKET